MAHGHSSHGHELGHIIEPKVTWSILIVLLVLTVITVAVAQVDFGSMNIVVALLIASLKASLVVLYFMHGRYENKVLWIYILVPFILVVIMIGGTLSDNPYRDTPEPMKVEGVK